MICAVTFWTNSGALAGTTGGSSMLLVALVVALAVGLGFGFYPAWHAAGLEPMDALRRE